MRNDWHGLIKILEIQHIRNNEVIWENKNLYNTVHLLADEYMLKCLFVNDGTLLPTSYYLGMDNRTTVATTDTITDLVDEPSSNGYQRQSLGIEDGWTVQYASGAYRAIGDIITFNATGGGYGPLRQLFLTNKIDNSGVLLATVPLTGVLNMSSGDSINLRMSLSLKDYS